MMANHDGKNKDKAGSHAARLVQKQTVSTREDLHLSHTTPVCKTRESLASWVTNRRNKTTTA